MEQHLDKDGKPYWAYAADGPARPYVVESDTFAGCATAAMEEVIKQTAEVANGLAHD